MKISYAICVCNEARELFDLLTFLIEVKRSEDEIVVLRDSGNTTDSVTGVLKKFSDVKVHDREFKRDFADHKNYLTSVCTGDYIFNIDADEIPQEMLIKVVEKAIEEPDAPDLIWVPRINICPGYTPEFLKRHNFACNENGWINWPDYQGRVYTRNLQWAGKIHEKIQDAKNSKGLQAHPQTALWHIKSTNTQDDHHNAWGSIEN
jgi:glycosyltransferase involved in cell wall biosynthesis